MDNQPDQPVPASLAETAPDRSPAVLRCCEARDLSRAASRAKKLDCFDASQLASLAFRTAIPDLSGYENIRDFIACVSYGMVIGVIDSSEAPKFLYAAQVAIAALRTEPKSAKHPTA